jgi:hypothetical protein
LTSVRDPEINDKYAGTIGMIQGEKKDTIPAQNAIINDKSAIQPPSFIKI